MSLIGTSNPKQHWGVLHHVDSFWKILVSGIHFGYCFLVTLKHQEIPAWYIGIKMWHQLGCRGWWVLPITCGDWLLPPSPSLSQGLCHPSPGLDCLFQEPKFPKFWHFFLLVRMTHVSSAIEICSFVRLSHLIAPCDYRPGPLGGQPSWELNQFLLVSQHVAPIRAIPDPGSISLPGLLWWVWPGDTIQWVATVNKIYFTLI